MDRLFLNANVLFAARAAPQETCGYPVRDHAGRNDHRWLLHAVAIRGATGRNPNGGCEKTAQISYGASHTSRPFGCKQRISRAGSRRHAIDGCALSNSSPQPGSGLRRCHRRCKRRCGIRVLQEVWIPRTPQNRKETLPADGQHGTPVSISRLHAVSGRLALRVVFASAAWELTEIRPKGIYSEGVLVQPEMERGRSPLVSNPPLGASSL